jgi:hypothetical protein
MLTKKADLVIEAVDKSYLSLTDISITTGTAIDCSCGIFLDLSTAISAAGRAPGSC